MAIATLPLQHLWGVHTHGGYQTLDADRRARLGGRLLARLAPARGEKDTPRQRPFAEPKLSATGTQSNRDLPVLRAERRRYLETVGTRAQGLRT